MDIDRFQRQIEFAIEIDKLKRIVRQTLLTDGSRQEDSAEHSWHIAVLVLVLFEYAKDGKIDVLRVLKMVLIHDLVEIDARHFCPSVLKSSGGLRCANPPYGYGYRATAL